MNHQHSSNPTSSQSGLGSGISLLGALHESRRDQAMRGIDQYRHLLSEAEADEIRRATEEFTRERVSIRSLCRIWQPRLSWISPLMKGVRA